MNSRSGQVLFVLSSFSAFGWLYIYIYIKLLFNPENAILCLYCGLALAISEVYSVWLPRTSFGKVVLETIRFGLDMFASSCFLCCLCCVSLIGLEVWGAAVCAYDKHKISLYSLLFFLVLGLPRSNVLQCTFPGVCVVVIMMQFV